jgi:Predicted transcriptional regulators
MKERELRRSMAVFPIGTVMKLTDLSARQIRYYEDQKLIFPARTEGNRRIYSLNDLDVLLEIKDYISEGLNIAQIHELYDKNSLDFEKNQNKSITDEELRRVLEDEMMRQSRFMKNDSTHFNQKPI